MSLEDKIIQYLHELPESKMAQVLDFVKCLRNENDEKDWSDMSLASAMRGMESETSPYLLKI